MIFRGGSPLILFLSTPSARRATYYSLFSYNDKNISIHALREEGDTAGVDVPARLCQFLSTPSARRATHGENRPECSDAFLSTPSARRATSVCFSAIFSTLISIHALREEGDVNFQTDYDKRVEFLSTPSARRATQQDSCRLHERKDFYPRPPRGGRPESRDLGTNGSKFLSTPSARRATAKTETKSLFSNKLYNILHEFRRALIYNGSKNYPNHAK